MAERSQDNGQGYYLLCLSPPAPICSAVKLIITTGRWSEPAAALGCNGTRTHYTIM